jgi:Xaa-Pro aminopeptidase
VRETFGGTDPILSLIYEGGLTWQSALVVFANGYRVAVVGNYDANAVEGTGDWNHVVPYVQSIREPLLEVLRDSLPAGRSAKIAANFSVNDVKADGLTHGMYMILSDLLKELNAELVTAESLLAELRGSKSTTEVVRMRVALDETDRLFEDIAEFTKIGTSEADIQAHVHNLMRERSLGFAWDSHGNPIVNSGPNSEIGHGIPSDKIRVTRGHILHVDLGVTTQGYSSDIQRCWYIFDPVPAIVQKAFDAVHKAITAGAEALVSGAMGWEVDAAARASLVASGYPEFLHAFGHQVGQVAHDGGTVLGPRWERYGDTPYRRLREGEVYTLELGVVVPGHGYLGLEEIARVTPAGCDWLSNRQDSLPVLLAPGA